MVYPSTASTCSLVTPGNHDRKSSTEAPPSIFTNRATTEIRVLRKTHEPLTFSGSRSTAEQEDQSIIGERYLPSFSMASVAYVPNLLIHTTVASMLRYASSLGRMR